jgi:hypothetical protein
LHSRSRDTSSSARMLENPRSCLHWQHRSHLSSYRYNNSHCTPGSSGVTNSPSDSLPDPRFESIDYARKDSLIPFGFLAGPSFYASPAGLTPTIKPLRRPCRLLGSQGRLSCLVVVRGFFIRSGLCQEGWQRMGECEALGGALRDT